jgi:hypothetical protein
MQNVTRRSALKNGGIAAIVAGLIGTIGTAPAAAAAIQATALGTVAPADLADMTAEALRLRLRARETMDAVNEAGTPLWESLTPAQRKLYEGHDDLLAAHFEAAHDWHMAELFRHFPGLSPALFATWQHVMESHGSDGTCCFPDPKGRQV